MGIFSDKCQALIDGESGRALTGEALAKARQERKWPRCGNRVPRAARFCNACGQAAPGGWWQCPACGKWVGNDSRFCAHCDTPLQPESRVDMAGGVWRKGPETLAQRFEAGDVKRLLKNGLQVQPGTVAVLLEAGKVGDTLGPGRHEPDGLARKINWFGNPPPRSVVLVEAGDIVLPVRVEELRSAEQIPLEFYGEIVLRFEPRLAGDFLENLFKGAEALSYAELGERLGGEIRHAVDEMCVASTIDDLVRDPKRRLRLEDVIEGSLKPGLERCGFSLVRVSQAEFLGDAYDALAEKSGEVEQVRRRIELDQRLAEMLDKEKMGRFKSEAEIEEYAAQLAQERGVSELHRGREIEILKTGWRRQDQLDEARRLMTRERDETGHKIGIASEWDGYNRDKLVADADAKARARDKEFEQEARETDKALEWRKEKNRIRQQDLAATADTLKGRSLQDLMALIDDPDKRRDLLAFREQEIKSGMSERQILAMAVEKSPAAAEALARMAGSEQVNAEARVEESRKLMKDMLDRDERILKTALEPGVEAARNKTGSTHQIIK
jgi:hypothetical protein